MLRASQQGAGLLLGHLQEAGARLASTPFGLAFPLFLSSRCGQVSECGQPSTSYSSAASLTASASSRRSALSWAAGSSSSSSSRSFACRIDDLDSALASRRGFSADAAAPSTGAEGQSQQVEEPLGGIPEELLSVLLHPMPPAAAGKANMALDDIVIKMNGMLYMDPAKGLESTMRALHAIKQVLRQDGHVLVHNANKRLVPLMREAAHCCLNPNVWFSSDDWVSGALSDPELASRHLFLAKQQPNRRLLQERGVPMINAHCPATPVLSKPKPSLAALDKQRILAAGGHKGAARGSSNGSFASRGEARAFMRRLVKAETSSAQLPIPNSAAGAASKLSLLVVMDLTHGAEAVAEAYRHNVMTASLVNSHSDLSGITYPIYASESHLAFQHFFMDWLLKVANLPVDS